MEFDYVVVGSAYNPTGDSVDVALAPSLVSDNASFIINVTRAQAKQMFVGKKVKVKITEVA